MNGAQALGNMQSLLGTTQGNSYQIERLIHEGRHGALFEAKQIRLGFRCVVRLLSVEAPQRKTLLVALSQQMQLSHPGLWPVTDAMQLSDNLLLLATPLLPGQSLADKVASQGRLSLSEGLSVLRTVIGALYALHQKGLCHGSVSSHNVQVVGFDDVAVDGALGGGKVNQRAILLDGGLYTALGENASAADDQAAVAKLVEETVADLTPALRNVLNQAKDANPDRRFQTLQAMWQAIEAARGRKVASAVPTAVVGAVRMPNLLEQSARWPLLAAAAAFTLLAVVIAVVSLRNKPAAVTTVGTGAVQAPEQVTIQLELSPDTATVTVGGKNVKTPLRLGRSTAPVSLRIEADGYDPVTSQVVPDQDRALHISLAKTPAAADPPDAAKKSRKSKKRNVF